MLPESSVFQKLLSPEPGKAVPIVCEETKKAELKLKFIEAAERMLLDSSLLYLFLIVVLLRIVLLLLGVGAAASYDDISNTHWLLVQ